MVRLETRPPKTEREAVAPVGSERRSHHQPGPAFEPEHNSSRWVRLWIGRRLGHAQSKPSSRNGELQCRRWLTQPCWPLGTQPGPISHFAIGWVSFQVLLPEDEITDQHLTIGRAADSLALKRVTDWNACRILTNSSLSFKMYTILTAFVAKL